MDLHFIFESNDDNVVFKYRFLLIYFFLFFSVSTYVNFQHFTPQK